jgi:hypothetical protein
MSVIEIQCRSRRLAALLTAMSMIVLLSACPPSSNQVKVPATDSTPPDALWMQADIPGKPYLNVTPGSAPASTTLNDDATVRITALGTDSDGGAKEVRIFESHSRSKPGVNEGPTLAGAPVAKNTSSAQVGDLTDPSRSTTFDLKLSDLKGSFHTLTVDLWAEVENFHGGITRTSHMTLKVVWVDVHLFVIPLTDSDGMSHAPNVTAAQFADLIANKTNLSFRGTGIHLVFDATQDWHPMNDTDLNSDGADMQTRGNAIAQLHPGRIVCLLRWGSDPSNPTGNGNAFPPPIPGETSPFGVNEVQQDYVALPNQIQTQSFLELQNGSFVAHELGHYLGLYHTFNGWTDRNGPIFGGVSPWNWTGAQQAVVDWIGSHGGTISALDGDLLSDTSPDPSPAFYDINSKQDICAQATIVATGTSNGQSVSFTFHPDPQNVMSYFGGCVPPGSPAGTLPEQRLFSAQQITKMNATLRGARIHLLTP